MHSVSGSHEVERQTRDMSDEDRWQIRQKVAVPFLKTLHDWMLAQRDLVPNGSATAKALDYGLKRWVALTCYLDDGGKRSAKAPFKSEKFGRSLCQKPVFAVAISMVVTCRLCVNGNTLVSYSLKPISKATYASLYLAGWICNMLTFLVIAHDRMTGA
ncbi:hypothetical protein PPUJ13061_55700 [Pseudomonas putida]|nr:hypothetical protein PPUJ13061_55700 [Pseudomonas putida]